MKSVSDMNLSWICDDEYNGVQMCGEKLPGGFYSSVMITSSVLLTLQSTQSQQYVTICGWCEVGGGPP